MKNVTNEINEFSKEYRYYLLIAFLMLCIYFYYNGVLFFFQSLISGVFSLLFLITNSIKNPDKQHYVAILQIIMIIFIVGVFNYSVPKLDKLNGYMNFIFFYPLAFSIFGFYLEYKNK